MLFAWFFFLHQYLRVAMQLLFKGPVSSLSLSCPYHLFHCLSGIFNKAFSFNGQNIAINIFIVCVMQYLVYLSKLVEFTSLSGS